MIVHCSDGVGRAGTYVLIDMVLNRMMKGSKEIDIAATLEHIRDQRSGEIGGLKPLPLQFSPTALFLVRNGSDKISVRVLSDGGGGGDPCNLEGAASVVRCVDTGCGTALTWTLMTYLLTDQRTRS